MKRDRRIKQCEFDLEDQRDNMKDLQASIKVLQKNAPNEAVNALQVGKAAAVVAILFETFLTLGEGRRTSSHDGRGTSTKRKYQQLYDGGA